MVRLWDARTGQPYGQPLPGHQECGVTSVSLCEVDGVPVLVSGGCEGTVRLWDAHTREQFGLVYTRAHSLCMRPHSRSLVVGSNEGLFMLQLMPPTGKGYCPPSVLEQGRLPNEE